MMTVNKTIINKTTKRNKKSNPSPVKESSKSRIWKKKLI